MDDFSQHATELRVYGYTLLDNVLDGETVERMRDTLQQAAAELGVESTHRGTARHLANLVTIDPVFFECIDHPRVLPLVEDLMGNELILGSLSARLVRPGDPGQTLHSDVPFGLHRYGTEAPVMMNTVWALDDFSSENGGTRLVPGSHQSHLFEPPDGFIVKHEIQPAIKSGSVIVTHGQTWHGGGANHTNANRHAIFGHYRNGSWMRFQCDPHHGFDPAWLDRLSPRQKQLLRMEHGLSDKLAADFYER